MTDFHFDSLLYVMSAMMHKFDKFIVDPTVIDHDNMMIEINEKIFKSTMPLLLCTIYGCIHFYVFWDSASFQNGRSPMCLCRNCLQSLRQHSHQKKWHKNSTERVCIGFCCCRCGGELHRKFWYFAPPNLLVRSSR